MTIESAKDLDESQLASAQEFMRSQLESLEREGFSESETSSEDSGEQGVSFDTSNRTFSQSFTIKAPSTEV